MPRQGGCHFLLPGPGIKPLCSCVSCTGRWVFLSLSHLGSLIQLVLLLWRTLIQHMINCNQVTAYFHLTPNPTLPTLRVIVITNLPGGSSLALSGSDQERKCIVGQDGTWRRSQGPAGIDCIICALSFVTHSETPGTGSQGRVRIWRAGETLPCGIL